jgi:hypothetical protein
MIIITIIFINNVITIAIIIIITITVLRRNCRIHIKFVNIKFVGQDLKL